MILPTLFPLKPPFSKGFPWNFPHEITIDPRGEGTRHPTLRGAAAPKKVTVTVTENPPMELVGEGDHLLIISW